MFSMRQERFKEYLPIYEFTGDSQQPTRKILLLIYRIKNKTKLREAEKLAQGHTALREQSQAWESRRFGFRIYVPKHCTIMSFLDLRARRITRVYKCLS